MPTPGRMQQVRPVPIFRRADHRGGLMKKEIRLNAFAMNCVAHQSPGLWTHPRDRTADYNRLPYWTRSGENAGARTVRWRCFWPMCSASMTCSAAVRTRRLRNATQTPVNDPLLLIPAMAAVTENLGFGVTSQPVLRAALHVRAADVDARPSHRGPHRLECRDRLSRQRGAGRRQGQADRA